MGKWCVQIAAPAAVAALLISCGMAGPVRENEEPIVVEEESLPSASPPERAQPGGEIAAPDDLVTAMPPALPTRPPLMSVWPLEADLYYLNDAGQVWKQPLLGDDSAASAVTSLDAGVRDFAVAPGGEWIMTRTDAYITVSSVDGLSGQLIADIGPMPEASFGTRTLAWSPDASKLAYATPDGFEVYIPGAGPDFGPLIFPVTELPLKDIAWSHDAAWLLIWRQDGSAALYGSDPRMWLWVEIGGINGYTWLLDGRLAFAPSEGGLALLEPNDLESRVFVVPQDRQVSLPAQHPDGTLAFFVHGSGVDLPGALHLADPVDLSFRQESGIPVDTRGWVWNPLATRLLGLDPDDPGRRTVILLDPATGSTGSFEVAGPLITLDWGDPPPRGLTRITLPDDLYFLSPEAGVIQVWRLPANSAAPEVLTSATESVVDFDISPDQTQVVYTSGGVIYRQVLGTVDVTQVATLDSQGPYAVISGTPAFSPTGREIAYANHGIWVLNLDTGQSRRLVEDNLPERSEDERQVVIYSTPRWSPDGAWLLVRAGYYEGYDHALLSTSGTPKTPIPLNLFVSDVTWSDDGTALVFSGGGAYSLPHLDQVEPGEPPVINRVFDLPVVDARLRADGRIAFLRIPSPYGIGPTSVRMFSALPDGSSLRAESGSFVLEEAKLSPGAVMIAGLIRARYNDFGAYVGQLAIANPGTGEVFVIEGVSNVSALQWGG